MSNPDATRANTPGQGTASQPRAARPAADSKELLERELQLGGPNCGQAKVQDGDEPRVTSVDRDLVGLALSGGGIRSATFNLGLLQGLAERRVLSQVDYLSTVSGGGYIGGWWSAWRAREEKRPGAPRPQDREFFPASASAGIEAHQVRHLREFSRFLVPRLGLFEIDTWQFGGALVTAVVPALIVAGAVLFTLLSCLLAIVHFAATCPRPDVLCGVATFALLAASEFQFARRQGVTEHPWMRVAVWIAIAVAAVAVLPALWPNAPATFVDPLMRPSEGGTPPLIRLVSGPAVSWLWAALCLVLLRAALSATALLDAGPRRAVLDRTVARLFGFAGLWVAVIGFVDLALILRRDSVAAAVWMGVTAGVLGLGFVVLRWWRSLRTPEVRAGGVRESIRLVTPRVLALASFALAALSMLQAVLRCWIDTLQGGWRSLAGGAILGGPVVVALAVVLFDPNRIGLHDFYRARIARAYLGASRWQANSAAQNRQTGELCDDDLPISALSLRPLHLVCCAANDLAGDNLGGLRRGARSATFSPLGFACGAHGTSWSGSGVSLGMALTASGAALNSNMGSLSADLGAAAAFLMTAFNVRLGYWFVPGGRIWNGAPFLREMFGSTRAGPGSFHLSDGGHFENLGLYELLRRHCRYVIVSDCGADPDVAFDDVGNALRRAREDFGVEIEIDLQGLCAGASGLAQQAVAVGDIAYPNGDRGVLVLLKPALVGDEPADVRQYHTRNRAFPHESTGDQFYDEAQWESYRRLGLHVARTAFRFVERPGFDTVPEIFGLARLEWYPSAPALRSNTLSRSAELYVLQRDLGAAGADDLLSEVYPELSPSTSSRPAPNLSLRVLPLLERMCQFMEDVYFSCELERHWNHPLNLGWMNCFGRWTAAPTFRVLWPLLSPLYSPKLARFLEAQFHLPSLQDDGVPGHAARAVVCEADGATKGMATWLWEQRYGRLPDDRLRLRFCLELTDGLQAEVALALVRHVQGEPTARWGRRDFFVPPSLWGAGIGARFLPALAEVMAARNATELCVTLDVPDGADDAGRKAHADLVQMYRQAGFNLSAGAATGARAFNPVVLVKHLATRGSATPAA